jgi:hypothetical protein
VLLAGAACAIALGGCAQAPVADHDATRPAAAPFVVTLADGTRFEGTPLHIVLAEDAEVPAQASITAYAADGRAWSAMFGLSLAQVRRASVSLQQRPLAEGVGMVGLISGDRLQDFGGGTLVFALGASHVAEGQVTTDPASGSATFRGTYVVTCWVHPRTLQKVVDGDGDGEVRIEDVRFASPFCRPFADLR